MQNLLRTIFRILDGAPSSTQKTSRRRQRGQSLLELAFITPLLAVMIAGIVEIGWYANNILSLMEVSRVGGRAGAVLTGDFDPRAWVKDASIHPSIQTGPMAQGSPTADSQNARQCGGSFLGFYNFIMCTVLTSMGDDLPLRVSADAIDDIVISVFALQTVNNADPVTVDPVTDPELYKITVDFDNPPGGGGALVKYDSGGSPIPRYPDGTQVIVVGRYPQNANECTHKKDTVGGSPQGIALDEVTDWDTYEYDPFDYITDNLVNSWISPTGIQYFMEQIAPDTSSYIDAGAEYQRGFVATAQHRVGGNNGALLCWGSEWTIEEVQDLMNLPSFIRPILGDPTPNPLSQPTPYAEFVASQQQRQFIPSQGMILVEIFWEHTNLLQFPLIEPLLSFFPREDGKIIVSVWSAFPLPAVEPSIIYRLP